jgi:alkylation response protein AidB-like acyl-CoA dehydrogenase
VSIYDLTEENRAVRERTRSFAEEEISPNLAEWEGRDEFPYEIIRRMGEEGFYGACFPEEYGGSELGFLNLAIICEEISRVSPGIGSTFNAQAMTVPFTILNWGTKQQIARYVPPLIKGEKIGFFSLTEPGGGSDAAGSMKTRASRDGADGYLLDGHKKWASLAGIAHTGVLFAKTDPEATHKGVSAFIVETDAPGFVTRKIPTTLDMHLFPSFEILLEDCRVPSGNLLGDEGDGFRVAMNALDFGRLTIPARAVGVAQACLERAVEFCNERVVGGHRLGEYQLIQGLIADMTVQIEAARLLTYKSAHLKDRGEATTRESAHSKYFAAETLWNAAQALAEIYGGRAVALEDEYPVSRYLSWANLFRTGEGPQNIQRVLISEDTLGFKDANRHNIERRFPLKSDL